jgi:hypothetical protein
MAFKWFVLKKPIIKSLSASFMIFNSPISNLQGGREVHSGVNMKTIKMKQRDEKEEDIADTLISSGINRNVAMMLAYMQNANSATSIELERLKELDKE